MPKLSSKLSELVKMRFSLWKGPSYNSCKGLFTAGKDLSQFYSAAECFNHPLFSKHSIWTQFQFVIIRAINLSMGDVSKSILSYLSKERQQHIRPWWSRSSLRNRLFWKLSIIMWCYNNRVMWVTIKGKLDFQISRYSLDANLPILGRWLPAWWTHLPNTSAKKDIFINTGFYGPWHPLKTDPWFDKDLWHILTIKTAEYIHITRVHMIAPDSTLLNQQCPTNWGCYHRTIALFLTNLWNKCWMPHIDLSSIPANWQRTDHNELVGLLGAQCFLLHLQPNPGRAP